MKATPSSLAPMQPDARRTAKALTPAVALTATASLTQFDVTAMAVALPVIGAELELGPAGAAWVMDAYSLAFAALLLTAGMAADRWGRRRVLVHGNAVFALASLLGGLAWDAPSLWVARALQGAAAAFVISGALACLSLAYPNPVERARAFGVLGVVSGAAMALGPAIGGILTGSLGWRWIFLGGLPICMVAGWTVARVVEESRATEGRPFDLPGLALLTLALVLPVHGMLRGDARSAWSLVEYGTGITLVLAFVLQQRQRRHPMLDPLLFARPAAVGVGMVLVALSVGYWAVLIYLPPFFTAALGYSPERNGLAMLAATLPMVAFPPLGARMVQRWGIGRSVVIGLALIAGSTAALAVAAGHPTPSTAAVLIAAAAAGGGAGLIHSQLSGALVGMALPSQAGMASAVTITLRQAGFAFGIAVLGVATQPAADAGAAYVRPFAIAAGAAVLGAIAALGLLRQHHSNRPPREDATEPVT